MWIARNKLDNRLKVFELPPRRFHDGACLDSKLVGFNDSISVGDGKDDYSFWAEQMYCDSNRIDDIKCYGFTLFTEGNETTNKVWFSYEPEWARDLKWEDEPVEVEITRKIKL